MLLLAGFTFTTALFAQTKATENTQTSTHHMAGKMHGKMQDCVMMEDGKMMAMMGGKTSPMDKDMTMKNGTTVMTDGTVKMKDGKTMMLKDGQCVYTSGKVSSMKMGKMKGHKM